jgi:hypothetical protein
LLIYIDNESQQANSKFYNDLCLAEHIVIEVLTFSRTNFIIIQKLTAEFYEISCFYFVTKKSIIFCTFAKIL